MLRRLLAFLLFLLIRLLTRSYRYRCFDTHHSALALEQGRPVLYAFFHGKQLVLLGYPVPMPMVQMVSLSKDGALQAEILRLLGFSIVRGSSGRRGQEALYEMTDLVLNGCHAALAVDGSRGPLHKVREGILHLARDTGGVVVPLASAARSRRVFAASWDHYELPYPFSRVAVVEGPGIRVHEDMDDEEFEALRKDLESNLIDLNRKAERIVNNNDLWKGQRAS